MKYLGERNIAIFSTDIDSFDFKMRKPEQVVQVGDGQAGEARQGHHPDARLPARDRGSRCPELLKQLKDGGYKVVQIVGKTPIEPKQEYVDAGAQGDRRRPRRGAADVERDQDHRRQLISGKFVKPAAQDALRGRFFF